MYWSHQIPRLSPAKNCPALFTCRWFFLAYKVTNPWTHYTPTWGWRNTQPWILASVSKTFQSSIPAAVCGSFANNTLERSWAVFRGSPRRIYRQSWGKSRRWVELAWFVRGLLILQRSTEQKDQVSSPPPTSSHSNLHTISPEIWRVAMIFRWLRCVCDHWQG